MDDQDHAIRALSRALVAEHMASGRCDPSTAQSAVEVREFVSARCRARGVSTGTATLPAGAELPCHLHAFSEAITVLESEVDVYVEGRRYRLSRLDCIHLPAGAAHRVVNTSAHARAVVHWAFASAEPALELVDQKFPVLDRNGANPRPEDPEYIVRFSAAEIYPLADGTRFCDLFAGRFGSVGICGGYGEFEPGAALPCHVHRYDESITIVSGEAVCQVAGRQYTLAGCDTAFVPEGRPHRFLNRSGNLMSMIWVYAGSEPERTLMPAGYCDGSLPWPGDRSAELKSAGRQAEFRKNT